MKQTSTKIIIVICLVNFLYGGNSPNETNTTLTVNKHILVSLVFVRQCH